MNLRPPSRLRCDALVGAVLQNLREREAVCRHALPPGVPRAAWPFGGGGERAARGRRWVVASVPRSGNHWLRDLLVEMGAPLARAGAAPGAAAPPRVATRRECGRESDGAAARAGAHVFLAKSHWPFATAQNCGCAEGAWSAAAPGGGGGGGGVAAALGGDASCVVRLAREPAANYDAWMRYLAWPTTCDEGGAACAARLWTPPRSCARFLRGWAQFHAAWSAAAEAGADAAADAADGGAAAAAPPPVVTVRYEDLVAAPAAALRAIADGCAAGGVPRALFDEDDFARAVARHPSGAGRAPPPAEPLGRAFRPACSRGDLRRAGGALARAARALGYDGAADAADADGRFRNGSAADVDDARAREVLTRQATWFDVDVADGYDMAVVSTAGGRQKRIVS